MSEVDNIKKHIENLKEIVDIGDSMERLSRNRDFKKVILDYFCEKECARYVQASVDPSMTESERADALRLAQSAGLLKRFIHVVTVMGDRAKEDLTEAEKALIEASMEE